VLRHGGLFNPPIPKKLRLGHIPDLYRHSSWVRLGFRAHDRGTLSQVSCCLLKWREIQEKPVMRYKTLALTLVILCIFPGLVTAQAPPQDFGEGTVIASGLNAPQGITADADGNLWVIESGLAGDEDIQFMSPEAGKPAPSKMGPTARIVMVSPDGEQTEVAALPSIAASDMENVGGARLTWLNGVLYATSGAWIGGLGDPPDLTGTVVRVENSNVTQVADTWAYEEANNSDGLVLESHPYGVTAGPDGWLWIADS
jgi:hypothetical protein